jgi:general secretion pathway protein N
MRRPAALLAAGLAAFILFLLAFLPATFVLRLAPAELSLEGLAGSVWKGSAASVRWRGHALGAVSWSNRFWRLPLLELNYAVRLDPPGGGADVDVVLRSGGRLDLQSARGTLPVAMFQGFLAPAGWTGEISLDVERLSLRQGRPVAAAGTVLARGLGAATGPQTRIGDFELILGEGQVGAEGIAGRLRDLDKGPLQVRATITLDASGAYVMSGEVAAGPGSDPGLQRSLAYLGPPDSLGRRSFTIEGTL